MTNKLSHIFECSDHITEKQYRTSRALFILDGCASTQIFTVTSGAFLSGLAYLVGAGTALTGIIAALPTLMNTIQIFSSVVYENRAGSKRITVEFALIQRLCLLMMLFVPTLMLGARISVAVIAVLYSCAHFCGAFINTGANNWLISLVKKERLGRYLGLKDSMTLVASTGGSLILSKILDAYRFADQEILGFRIIGILCIGICVVDITCLTLIREPENVKHVEPLNIRKAIQMPLTDQNYRNILIFFLLWSVASNFASPFFSIYMLENLGLSYFYITVMNMVASVARIAAANLWGKAADSYSWRLVTLGSIFMLGVAYIGWGTADERKLYLLASGRTGCERGCLGRHQYCDFSDAVCLCTVRTPCQLCQLLLNNGWVCRIFFIHARLDICGISKGYQDFKHSGR